MGRKRQEARERTARVKTMRSAAAPIEPAPGQVDQRARRDEVIPWLRQLGLRADEAKRGAAMCDDMTEASLGDRVKFALSGLARERFRASPPMARIAD